MKCHEAMEPGPRAKDRAPDEEWVAAWAAAQAVAAWAALPWDLGATVFALAAGRRLRIRRASPATRRSAPTAASP
jgi:hypothetical protein